MDFCNNQPDIGSEINRAMTAELYLNEVPAHVDLGIQDAPTTGGLKYDGGKTMLGLFPP